MKEKIIEILKSDMDEASAIWKAEQIVNMMGYHYRDKLKEVSLCTPVCDGWDEVWNLILDELL